MWGARAFADWEMCDLPLFLWKIWNIRWQLLHTSKLACTAWENSKKHSNKRETLIYDCQNQVIPPKLALINRIMWVRWFLTFSLLQNKNTNFATIQSFRTKFVSKHLHSRYPNRFVEFQRHCSRSPLVCLMPFLFVQIWIIFTGKFQSKEKLLICMKRREELVSDTCIHCSRLTKTELLRRVFPSYIVYIQIKSQLCRTIVEHLLHTDIRTTHTFTTK